MSNETQINPNLIPSSETAINPAVSVATEINVDILNKKSGIARGTFLVEEYKVLDSLDVTTGEADLFLCERDNSKFVAKVYRRQCAIKSDVVEILKNINSPYVAKLQEIGTYEDMPFEILPYYSKGSISGQMFTLELLKTSIIPAINEGLRQLHLKNIFHKDIKPSNLMFLDDEQGVAIIDFGISSVTDDGSTVLLTKTGMTPEYSAPEAIQSLFSEESDYYSLGITIFELFSGSTPYKNMTAEEIARYTALQKFPFPDNIPEELKHLIQGLTYTDITNRHDKSNPNRRWTYEEVCKWLNGEKQVIPGFSKGALEKDFPPYFFLENEYETLSTLVPALAKNWEDGKKQLYRGLLSSFFKPFNSELAGFCLDSEEELTEHAGQEDFIFWKLLYKLSPNTTVFYWKSLSFEALPVLGRNILEKLWAEDFSEIELWNEILSLSLLSQYLILTNNGSKQQHEAVESVEIFQRLKIINERAQVFNHFCTGYLLSGQTLFCTNEQQFKTPKDLSAYMEQLLQSSLEELRAFCHSLIQFDDTLDPQLEAWLIVLGKREELQRWRSLMSL